MPLTTSADECIHGVRVNDPYRWLEDRDLPATETWIREQQERCGAYFSACPELALVESRVREYLDVETIDQPARVGDRYFYRRRRKGQEQGSICVRDGEGGFERVLVDPAHEGRFTAVGICRISPDASLLAYEVKRGGDDRKEIRIVDVNNGVNLPDTIPMGYARGFAFARKGYFYVHETDNSMDVHMIRYHAFGSTLPDIVVFRVPRTIGSRLVLTGNAFRLAAAWMRPQGSDMVTDLVVAAIEAPLTWQTVFHERRQPCSALLYRDCILAVVETASMRSELIELSLDGRKMRTVIPESEGTPRQLVVASGRIYAGYLSDDSATTIDVWSIAGERMDSITLPTGGTVQIQPIYDETAASIFYTFESFDTPPTIYEHCGQTNEARVWHQPRAVDPARRC
jgi:prolyl oligopeptidase